MAPSGLVPLHAGGTGSEEQENETYFRIPLDSSINLKISPDYSAAKHNGENLVPMVSDDPGPLVTWHGTSGTTEEEREDFPWIWKIGVNETPADLPIGVKVMKNRLIKVKVYKVASKEVVSGQPVRIVEPLIIPSKEEIRNYLYEVFNPQINADFEVVMSPEAEGEFHEIEWDISDVYNYDPAADPNAPHGIEVHDATLEYLSRTEIGPIVNPELWLIHKDLGRQDLTTNIHVYLVASEAIGSVEDVGGGLIVGSSEVGISLIDDRACFINAKHTTRQNFESEVV